MSSSLDFLHSKNSKEIIWSVNFLDITESKLLQRMLRLVDRWKGEACMQNIEQNPSSDVWTVGNINSAMFVIIVAVK